MLQTVDEQIARAFRPTALNRHAPRRQGEAGTSSGVNISPGSDDDGWIVPEPVTLEDGTRIQLYKDGEALHAAFEAIRNARRRICLESYIFASDHTGQAFANLLCAKASEGVQVFAIYDDFGSIDSDRSMFARMRHCGVNLQVFHPVRPWEVQFSWRPFNRDHRKLLVVDDDIAGLGGLNVGNEYAGSWVVQREPDGEVSEVWRDNAMGIRGPSAAHFLRAFSRMWKYIQSGGRITKAELLHNLTEGELGVLASVPTTASPLGPWLRKTIRDARESIDLTMSYFAPPNSMIDELCRAAKRGVRVRLMLPRECDVELLVTAARSYYETLLSAGVEVYERLEAVLHAKTMVIDHRLTVLGSTNLDYRSIEYNCELSAIVRSEQFGRQIEALFDNDVEFAEQITLENWRRRPMYDRFMQWCVSRARYLL